jgi:hypothetical protein
MAGRCGMSCTGDLVQKVKHRLHTLTNDSRPHSAVLAAAAAVSAVAVPPLTNDTALVFAVAAPRIEIPPPAVVAAGEEAPAVEPVAA